MSCVLVLAARPLRSSCRPSRRDNSSCATRSRTAFRSQGTRNPAVLAAQPLTASSAAAHLLVASHSTARRCAAPAQLQTRAPARGKAAARRRRAPRRARACAWSAASPNGARLRRQRPRGAERPPLRTLRAAIQSGRGRAPCPASPWPLQSLSPPRAPHLTLRATRY